MAKLFAIEKEIETLSFDEKVKICQEKSKPLVDDFFRGAQTVKIKC